MGAGRRGSPRAETGGEKDREAVRSCAPRSRSAGTGEARRRPVPGHVQPGTATWPGQELCPLPGPGPPCPPGPPTYFPWRRRSGGARRGPQLAAVAAVAAGRRFRAAAGAAVGVAARRQACSLPGPRCAWCPRRGERPERARVGVTRSQCHRAARGAGARAHLLTVCHPAGAGQLRRAGPQVLIVIARARLLAEVPRPPRGVGPAQALGAALA